MSLAEKTRGRRTMKPVRAVAIPVVATLVIGIAASQVLPLYDVYLATSAVIAAVSLLGLGVITGTAGMVALCQLSFAATGAWVVSELNLLHAPGGLLVWIWIGGLAAVIPGVLLAFPAMRLRGANLAVVTLGFAAALDLTLQRSQFPGVVDGVSVARPALFAGDRAYLIMSVVVLAVCVLVIVALQRGRAGTAWRFVAFSERATASTGHSVLGTKLSVFAVAAFTGGLAGGLLVGQIGIVYEASFNPIQSIAIYVLAVVSGSYLVDMAIFGGILWVAIPELLKQLGISQNWGLVIYGVLGIQAIAADGNLGVAIRGIFRRRSGPAASTGLTALATSTLGTVAPDASVPDTSAESARQVSNTEPLLRAVDLAVQFGQVRALDGVGFELPRGQVTGLIGPNGAGKSTLVDVVSGFLPSHTGTLELEGRTLGRLDPTRVARLGIRRTFQQDRVPASMSIGAYARFVAGRAADAEHIADVLDYFGCPAAELPLGAVDAGTRRTIEVAATIAARPVLALLDEPAAGLSHAEHADFAVRLGGVPRRFGVAVLLIEHDLDLVRSACTHLIAMNFGKVIAVGDPADVLSDDVVRNAYLGEQVTA